VSGPAATIRIVGPNPAVDRIEVLDSFVVNGVNRSTETRTLPGGKSMIVGRGVRRLGHVPVMYGFLGGSTGGFVRDQVVALGMIDRHVQIAGETRVTPILVDRSTGRSTVVNEAGPTVSAEEALELLHRLDDEVRPGDLVVTTGSLPPGLPDGFHGDVVGIAQRRGARAFVDTSGMALAEAVRRKPWLVKPNFAEFAELIHEPIDIVDLLGIGHAMQRVVERFEIPHLVVTLGEHGSIYSDGLASVHATAPEVEVRNPTGSGDLLLAGLVAYLAVGASMLDALRGGTAAGSAGASRLDPDLSGPQEVTDLTRGVDLRPLDTRLDAPMTP
jgi:1-phosphofructokinase family hexose kinase